MDRETQIDPIKRSLEEIDEELENAMSRLNSTNQRVDDLLNEFSSGELIVRRSAPAEAEATPPDTDDDEPAPEY